MLVGQQGDQPSQGAGAEQVPRTLSFMTGGVLGRPERGYHKTGQQWSQGGKNRQCVQKGWRTRDPGGGKVKDELFQNQLNVS